MLVAGFLLELPYALYSISLSLSTSGLRFRTVATPNCQNNFFLSLQPQFHVCTANKPHESTCFLPTPYLPTTGVLPSALPLLPNSYHASAPVSQCLSIPISSWPNQNITVHETRLLASHCDVDVHSHNIGSNLVFKLDRARHEVNGRMVVDGMARAWFLRFLMSSFMYLAIYQLYLVLLIS